MTVYTPSTSIGSRLVRLVGNRLASSAPGQGRLCILNYHRVLKHADPLLAAEPDVAAFRWQMKVLADCFHVMPLHEALDALAHGRMPPRAVCITFDDGYRSTHDLALPVLREFGFPATVFITTGYIDAGSMWNDRILESLRALDAEQLDLSDAGLGSYAVSTLAERREAVALLTERAKYLAPNLRHELVERLDRLTGAKDTGPMLTSDMIRNLIKHGVEIGAHTISHPILSKLSDESARFEIAESKSQLEAITGRPVRYFAYPNGKEGLDFDARHMAMAREAGFDAAFTTAIGAASSGDDRFALPRSRPWDTTRPFYISRMLYWLARRAS
ncbi:MAG TPA: polysaccharide deacetylase family protein [Telluria sp.]|jgi:peptidoglycan/xylan/chitin deacetylase (PgdA/CDA1 family)